MTKIKVFFSKDGPYSSQFSTILSSYGMPRLALRLVCMLYSTIVATF